MRRKYAAAAALVAVALAAGAAEGLPAGQATGAAKTPQAIAAAQLAKMSLAQRVGQLFMVGGAATGVPASTRSAVTTYHVGNVMLTDRSYDGVTATARITKGLKALVTKSSTAGVPLLLATDQEGGKVQVLQGPGFAKMASGRTQGTWSTAALRRKATNWANQLRAAGLNVNLAPVADTVPSAAFAPSNAPIGYYDREFGFSSTDVAAHTVAFLQGMAAAQVAATAKHFPGLGRVTKNPDTSLHVTDPTTTRSSPYLVPFGNAVKAGIPLVMVSTVTYTKIDANHPAAFSRIIVTDMLRGDLGFGGVVISDDLGKARQVTGYSLGGRALNFINAGGDIVLTVLPSTLPAMYNAVLAEAKDDAAFRAKVNQAALRVLTLKAKLGLIH